MKMNYKIRVSLALKWYENDISNDQSSSDYQSILLILYFSIAKKSMVEGNVSNEDRIGEATETSRKSDGNYIVADEGVTYDDEIKVLG